MTDDGNIVLPICTAANEDKFHAAMMVAITRLVAEHGKGAVAGALGVTIRQLDNIAAGSFPRPDRLNNLRALDPSALDPIDRLYNQRSVPRNATCSTDPVSAKLAALLTRTIEIERDDSPGGQDATLAELHTIDEPILRSIALKLAGWVERIDAYRAGEKPKLRVA